MARVLTFSQFFPSYHPQKGDRTRFVEKFWQSNHTDFDWKSALKNLGIVDLDNTYLPKHHTIRRGRRWKEGDIFSPRIWSGTPYKSKQIAIAPDTQVKKVWNIEIFVSQDELFASISKENVEPYLLFVPDLAKNDGLTIQQFVDWFNVKPEKPFIGQIICWNDSIEY